MRTILMTAYAVDPYKGSEEGTGWNLIFEAAKNNRVIAVTRKNNKQNIDEYMQMHITHTAVYSNIHFLYFDLPRWLIWWKKGPLLSALYFYIWQICVALWLLYKRPVFDIAHAVNFHSNWTPSFLWLLGRPFVWGPVGNHPKIPVQYLTKVYGRNAYIKDRLLWMIKCFSWYADPFVYICKNRAEKIFCVNSQSAEVLRIPEHKKIFMPAVASEEGLLDCNHDDENFTVLSVGRFVPLKGFDLTIRAFSLFHNCLPASEKNKTSLHIIGSGPEKERLLSIIKKEKKEHVITISDWMSRADVITNFKNSSAFLFPSHEGAGMVLAEAMSFGMPVICLDNYGPGEYVHPQTSLKVKQRSYDDTVLMLAGRLRQLYDNRLLYEKESRLSLERYRKLFRWPVKGTLMNNVYSEIMLANCSETLLRINLNNLQQNKQATD